MGVLNASESRFFCVSALAETPHHAVCFSPPPALVLLLYYNIYYLATDWHTHIIDCLRGSYTTCTYHSRNRIQQFNTSPIALNAAISPSSLPERRAIRTTPTRSSYRAVLHRQAPGFIYPVNQVALSNPITFLKFSHLSLQCPLKGGRQSPKSSHAGIRLEKHWGQGATRW